MKKHSWSSVRVWLKRWRDNGRDVRALIPNKEWRGNRTPRVGMTVERLEIFTEVIHEFYLQPAKRRTKRSLYKVYCDKCRHAGITQVEAYSSFCKRIKRGITDREDFAGQFGWRAALRRAIERGLPSVPMLLHAEVYHDFLPHKASGPMRLSNWQREEDVRIAAEDRARNPFLADDARVAAMIDALDKSAFAFLDETAGHRTGSTKTGLRGKAPAPYSPLSGS